MVPRQFLDLGPRGTIDTDLEVSNSLSDERTQSITPTRKSNYEDKNNEIVVYDEDKTRRDREESPVTETVKLGSGPNELPKLDTTTTTTLIDQSSNEAAATMRKARVSVRARSEAPMVIIIKQLINIIQNFS